jgi:Flp pilus assembly protein TadD
VVRFGLAASLSASGRHAEGDAHLRQAEQLDEKSWQAPLNLGLSLTSQVMLEEALTSAERAYSLAPWSGLCKGLLAGVLVRTGDRSRVEGLLQELRHGQGAGVAPGLTIFNLVCLETDQAADWAEKAIE